MARELDLRLVATPTVELPNVGLGNLSALSDAERSVVHELASVAARRKMAAESKAMPDGSFPIRNVPDLKKAVQAYGLARNKPRVKRFLVRRARALSRTDLLPEAWGVQPPQVAVLAAGDDGPQNGIMVAIYPPPEMADRLAGGQPGDLTPDDMHVTLAYLGTTDDVTPEQLNAASEAIGNVANSQMPFEAQVQGVGTFQAPESDDPQWYSVDAPGLAALRTQIVQALESVGVQPRVEHDFTPHMTVRYGGDQPQIPEGGDQPWGVHGLVLKAGPDADVHSFGHDFLGDDGDGDSDYEDTGTSCLICDDPEDAPIHQNGPPPAWMDAMDNPALLGQVNELVQEDGTVVEFVAAPGPCSLDRSPKHNWVEKAGGLPNYICQVARAVSRGGKSLESAIPIAIGTIKHWAAGGNHNGKKVSAAVQARAAAALAEWEAKKAKAHANGVQIEEFGFHWKHGWIPVDATARAEEKKKRLSASRAKNATRDEAARARRNASLNKNAAKRDATRQRHITNINAKQAAQVEIGPISGPSALELEFTTPSSFTSSRTYTRKPAGAAGGGQFAPGPARDAAAAKVQADPAAVALYSNLMSAAAGARAGQVKALSDADLQKLCQVIYSSKTSDPNVVAARIAVANEMSKRGFDVKHFGALGGGLSAAKSSPVLHTATPSKKAPVTTPSAPAPVAPKPTPAGVRRPGTAIVASAEEFAWNPDIRPADKHGRPIAKGHKVASPTGEPGTVVGNAPARGKQVVQVSQPKGSPISVPADQSEVLSPPEQPSSLNDVELKDRHAKISNDIAGHMQAQADDAKRQAEDPTATVADDTHQPEIDRLKTKRAPYAAEIAKRSAATTGDNVTASAVHDADADTYSYHWNPDTDETFRIGEDGNMYVFAPAVDEQEQPSWQAIDTYNGATQAADIEHLPKIEDPATLEAILGSTLALIADGAPAAPAVQEAPAEIDPPAEVEPGEDTTGRRFRIPIVVPEGVPSGDRRQFAEGALEAKEPPMPLLWQRETDDGHKRSVTVGRIDKITRLESGGLGDAEGVFDTHADAQEAARQVRERFLTGVSGDVDQFEAELSQSEGGEDSLLIKHGRLVAATLVAKPAFQEATIEMIPEEGESPVITAAGGPLLPPKAWFFKPSLDGPTMLSVTEDGRVFGHIAEWGTPHLGNPQLKPPRSPSNYRYFNRKPLRTSEGEDVKVGQLTLVGGHAKMSYDPDRAVKHYDDTNSAVADVVAGEDEFGIWVAGAMRPGVTPEQLRAFRASEPSGDWRMRDGNLELCAVCQVNVAGFPVTPRALVASGEVVALVAAGMVGHETRQRSVAETLATLASEVAVLKAEREAERRTALLETVQSLRR